MDFIRELGALVLDHRCRRLMETLLRSAEEVYEARGLRFRARWTSTYLLLDAEGPLSVTDIAQRIRVTHPGVIGITDEMREAGLVTNVADRGDGRRRLIVLTAAAKRQRRTLVRIWHELAAAQRERFASAGCDIIVVLNAVDDGMAERSLTAEVLQRLGKPQRATRRAVAARTLIAFGMMLGLASTLPAQQRTSPVTAANSEVVRAISEQLTARYIYEPTGRTMSDSLGARLSARAFDKLSDGALADTITALLFRISNDRHLGIRFEPSVNNAAPPAGQPVRRRTPAPATRPESLGFYRVERLPENIGYIELRGFSDTPEALSYADSVMAGFATVKALIIDLRENRGGGPEMVRLLSTYLFDKPTHLVSTFMRGMSAAAERWTLDTVRGTRLLQQPVYVLTSRRTISAAESFAFGLKVNKRVTIVGEPTAGGGHFGEVVTLPAGFSMFLPRGRTFDPRTNEGWEATGIQPDVAVPAEDALARALELIKGD